jgi:hypothetical protein
MPKRILTTEKLESLGAFISGDLLATIVVFSVLKDVAMTLGLTILTGLLGGAAALLGKDIYKWLKKKYFSND